MSSIRQDMNCTIPDVSVPDNQAPKHAARVRYEASNWLPNIPCRWIILHFPCQLESVESAATTTLAYKALCPS
ncbi:hypothetical protein RP20_CCG015478 [Aedes albopictus]|nr:hypothetical protein RP20_CCG015478 [Aedes albopictus]